MQSASCPFNHLASGRRLWYYCSLGTVSQRGSRLNSWQGQLRAMQRHHSESRKKEQKLTWGAGRSGTMPSPAPPSSRRKLLQDQSDPPKGRDLQIRTLGPPGVGRGVYRGDKIVRLGLCVWTAKPPADKLCPTTLIFLISNVAFPSATCGQPRTAKHLRKVSNKEAKFLMSVKNQNTDTRKTNIMLISLEKRKNVPYVYKEPKHRY